MNELIFSPISLDLSHKFSFTFNLCGFLITNYLTTAFVIYYYSFKINKFIHENDEMIYISYLF